MSELDNLIATVSAFSEMFISAHVLNLNEGSVYPIKSNQYINALVNVNRDLQGKLHNVMRNMTDLESIETMLEFIDLTTLQERLKTRKSVSCVFRGRVHGWCKASFIRMSEGDEVNQVLYAVENIDAEFGRELEEKTKLAKTSSKLLVILKGLALDYESLFYLDSIDGSLHGYEHVASDDHSVRIVDKNYGDYMTLSRGYMQQWVCEEDRERISEVSTIDYLKEHAHEGEIQRIDYGMIDASGTVNPVTAIVACVRDLDGHVYYVCGIHKIRS